MAPRAGIDGLVRRLRAESAGRAVVWRGRHEAFHLGDVLVHGVRIRADGGDVRRPAEIGAVEAMRQEAETGDSPGGVARGLDLESDLQADAKHHATAEEER